MALDYTSVNISDLYKTDIEFQISEYINTLPNEEIIYNRSNVFLGLLEHIYITVLYPIFFKDKGYNNDYDLLDKLFYQVYLPIVYKYGYTPTLFMYAAFIHTDNTYLSELLTGKYKDGSNVKRETTQTVAKWYNTCKAATFTRAIDGNSIGAIFAAKAAYGMSDQPKPETITAKDPDTISIDDIKQRYQLGDITKPDLSE